MDKLSLRDPMLALDLACMLTVKDGYVGEAVDLSTLPEDHCLRDKFSLNMIGAEFRFSEKFHRVIPHPFGGFNYNFMMRSGSMLSLCIWRVTKPALVTFLANRIDYHHWMKNG